MTDHQATTSIPSKTDPPNHTFIHVRLLYTHAELPWTIPPAWLQWKTSPSPHSTPYSSSFTEDMMTEVSAQVTVIHRVCSHQAANSYSFSFSYSSPVARFLGRFIESKFLPISSSAYGSEVWGFHLSWLMGSLNVVLKPNSNRIVLLLGICNQFNCSTSCFWPSVQHSLCSSRSDVLCFLLFHKWLCD